MSSSRLKNSAVLSRRQVLTAGAAAALLPLLPYSVIASFAQEGSDLLPFDPSAPSGVAADLPRRVGAVFRGTNAFYQSIDNALRQGATDAGLEYVSSAGDGSLEGTLQQGDIILNQGVASFYLLAENHDAELPLVTRALEAGVNVASVAGWPCTMQINGSQAAAGKKQADAAIAWIQANIGDRARVAYFNNDGRDFLLPRDQAVRDAFAAAGITIVADQKPEADTPEAGFNLMNTIIQRNPDVNVVLGNQDVTGGAVGALEAAGMTGDDIYVSVGNPSGAEMDLIEKGSVLRAGLLFPFEPMSYAIGTLTADWIAGKSVPAAITVPGGNLVIEGAEGVVQYRKDIGDLKALAASERFALYVGYWGNTRYEDRVADAWSQDWQQTNV